MREASGTASCSRPGACRVRFFRLDGGFFYSPEAAVSGVAAPAARCRGFGDTAIFTARHPLFLASSSPRRVAFLRELGLAFTCLLPPASAEPAPRPGEDAADYAVRAARAKADSVLDRAGPPPYAVIAADTVVVLRGRILGKPADAKEAYAMLARLAGRGHTVISGCAVLAAGAAPVTFAVRSRVRMWACPEDMLRAYANSGEPLDKAGAYAVQGAGAFLVERIDGSWSNVVGLPLAELVRELARLGAISA